jgi:hypothetical protein
MNPNGHAATGYTNPEARALLDSWNTFLEASIKTHALYVGLIHAMRDDADELVSLASEVGATITPGTLITLRNDLTVLSEWMRDNLKSIQDLSVLTQQEIARLRFAAPPA